MLSEKPKVSLLPSSSLHANTFGHLHLGVSFPSMEGELHLPQAARERS